MAVVRNLMVRCGADFSAISSETGRVQKNMKSMQDSIKKAYDSVAKLESDLKKAQAKLAGYDQEKADITQGTDEMLKNAQSTRQVENVLAIEDQQLSALNKKYATQLSEVNRINAALDTQRKKLSDLQNAQQNNTSAQSASERFAQMQQQTAEQIREAYEKAARAVSAGWQKAFQIAGKVASTGLKQAVSRIGGLFRKELLSVEKSTSRVKRRLKEIVSGALIFNGISAGLRTLTNYFSTAITQTGAMQQAMANLKGSAATAAAPLVQILAPALAGLANAAAMAFSYLSQLISFFTGKSVASMSDAAKSLSNVGSAAGGATKEIEDAKKSLASFDEINQLSSQEDSSGGGGGSASAPTPNYDFNAQNNAFLTSFTDAIKCLDFSGAATILTGKLNSMVSSVDWYGAGTKAGTFLDGTLQFLSTAITTFDWLNLGSQLAACCNGLLGSVDWGNLGTILSGKFQILLLTIGGFLLNLDWETLAAGFTSFATNFFNGIANALSIVDWNVIGNKIGVFLCEVDWAAISESVFMAFGAAFSAIGSFVGGLLENAWTDIEDYFQEWITKAEENGLSVADGILAGIGNGIASIGSWIKEHIFDPFMEGFKSAFDIHSPSKVMEQQGGYIIDGLFSGIDTAWRKISGFFDNALSGIERAFSEAWINCKMTAINIWDSIVFSIRNAVNGIIGAANGMISGVVNGINLIGQALNALRFTIPNWVPIYGGSTFGFNIPQISAPQIPYLAQGAVIPPNQEFLAVLGDQSHGTNIETPEDLLRQIYREESGSTEQIQLLKDQNDLLRQILAKSGTYLDGKETAAWLAPYQRNLSRSRGV